MIAKLTGMLDDFGPDWAVIDVAGVGYLVHASGKTLASLGNRGERVVLHTEMQISENDMRLIGFASAEERAWFRLLTAVQGVGSKVALAILSALSVEDLQRACAASDAKAITRANGVGAKLAGRIVNELADKAGAVTGVEAARQGGMAAAPAPRGGIGADAVSALTNLGFKPQIAAQAVSAALGEVGEAADVSTLIRLALKKVA